MKRNELKWTNSVKRQWNLKEKHMLPSSVACDGPIDLFKNEHSKGQEKYEKHCLNSLSAISGSTIILQSYETTFCK